LRKKIRETLKKLNGIGTAGRTGSNKKKLPSQSLNEKVKKAKTEDPQAPQNTTRKACIMQRVKNKGGDAEKRNKKQWRSNPRDL